MAQRPSFSVTAARNFALNLRFRLYLALTTESDETAQDLSIARDHIDRTLDVDALFAEGQEARRLVGSQESGMDSRRVDMDGMCIIPEEDVYFTNHQGYSRDYAYNLDRHDDYRSRNTSGNRVGTGYRQGGFLGGMAYMNWDQTGSRTNHGDSMYT